MLVNLDDILDLLRHPGRPQEPVTIAPEAGGQINVRSNGSDFPVVHGQPVLIDFGSSVVRRADVTGIGLKPLVERGRSSKLRRFAKSLFISTAKSAENFGRFASHAKLASPKPLIVVVGGGSLGEGAAVLYEDPVLRVLGFDIYPSAHTCFVADAHAIPLASGCADGVVVQAVLEHVVDPFKVVAEIKRILKPSGLVYAETPFLQHVHEGAYDFWRFTESGHRLLFRDFEPLSRGSLGGAGLSAYWSLRALMRDLARSRRLGTLLSLPFLTLLLLDRIMAEAHRVDSANGVYFLGRRLESPVRLHPADIYLGAQQ